MDCLITSTSRGEVMSVHVSGEVDIDAAADLRLVLHRAIATGFPDLVIDLRAVTFIDSTGLGVMVGALREARRPPGTVTLVVSNPRLLRVLRISGLDRVFAVRDSPDAAQV
jgi:anti-sigma B factor antagonist